MTIATHVPIHDLTVPDRIPGVGTIIDFRPLPDMPGRYPGGIATLRRDDPVFPDAVHAVGQVYFQDDVSEPRWYLTSTTYELTRDEAYVEQARQYGVWS